MQKVSETHPMSPLIDMVVEHIKKQKIRNAQKSARERVVKKFTK